MVGMLGVAAFLATFWVCHEHGYSAVNTALCIVAAYAITILVLEVVFLKTYKRPSTGLDFTHFSPSFKRTAIKLVGVYGTFASIACFYWLFPEYHGSFYDPYWDAISHLLPWIAGLTVPYVTYVDAYMKEPEDNCYWFGRCLLMHFKGVPARAIGQYVLGWIVKAFFLPLMFVGICDNIPKLMDVNLHDIKYHFLSFFHASLLLCYTLDLLVAIAGYTLTLRLFDLHIRSTEPTMFGWWICLMCYQPFLSVYMTFYLADRNNEDHWIDWLQPHPGLQMLWGLGALALIFIYVIASVNFGCRFSNLTHRGILTNGLYRFTKHPAYIAKNLHWWVVFVPFIPLDADGLRFSILLLGINLVYFFRARTEERHLSRDPTYVAYALWMNEHGIFRVFGNWFPFLRYQQIK